jgi:hypothetical protein
MYMQRENRELLALVFAVTIVLATSLAFGYLLYKHSEIVNLSLIFCVVGGLVILTGGVLFMVWPESYMPGMLILAGISEQALMFLIYIDVKLKYTGIIMIALLVLVLLCFFGLKELKLRLSDKELEMLESPNEFKGYVYEREGTYTVLPAKDTAKAEVIDIKTALEKRSPPAAG